MSNPIVIRNGRKLIDYDFYEREIDNAKSKAQQDLVKQIKQGVKDLQIGKPFYLFGVQDRLNGKYYSPDVIEILDYLDSLPSIQIDINSQVSKHSEKDVNKLPSLKENK